MIEMLYGLKSNDIDWDTAGQDKCFTGGAMKHSMSGGMPTAEDDGLPSCERGRDSVRRLLMSSLARGMPRTALESSFCSRVASRNPIRSVLGSTES